MTNINSPRPHTTTARHAPAGSARPRAERAYDAVVAAYISDISERGGRPLRRPDTAVGRAALDEARDRRRGRRFDPKRRPDWRARLALEPGNATVA